MCQVLLLMLLSTVASSQVYIRTNLAGYHTQDHKSAVVFSNTLIKDPRASIINHQNQIVKNPLLIPSDKTGFAPYPYCYTVDFSSLQDTGHFSLLVAGHGGPVYIHDQIYKEMPDVLLEFMRQQRCGYNPFFDAVCHPHDGRMMDGPFVDSTYVDVSGGWHDAGDQLKYLITASNATARMLMAYQLFPSIFKDQFNALGQRGPNKIADVLDEAKWGLDWIIKLHVAEEVLVHQIADDRDHVGWKYPMQDPSNYGWGKNSYRVAYVATGRPQGLNKYKSMATGISNLAGRSSAALALGHVVWKKNKLDDAFAKNCLIHAEQLYKMAKNKPGYQQGNSYGAPYRYNEDTWTDDMEWAATELFKATGKAGYLTDAKKYAEMTGELSWIQKDTSAHYQFYPFLNIAHYSLWQVADASHKMKLVTYYKNGIKKTLDRAQRNVYSQGVPFIWCSNNLVTDLIVQIYLYEKMSGDFQFTAYKYALRDWLLGRNPWGTSMFMNIPGTGPYPKDVHTSTWALTHKEVPGGLVDGPIYYSTYKTQLGLQLTHADAYAAFQNEYVVYHDDLGDYVTNEPTMDGTACAIMMLACFSN